MIIPSCGVYLDKKSNEYKLESFAISKEFGWTTSCGVLRLVSENEMRQNGLEIVKIDLSKFESRVKDEKSELEKMTPQQLGQFNKRHKNVGISLRGNILRIDPMEKCEGGHIGVEGGEILIDISSSNEDFYERLMEAFDKC